MVDKATNAVVGDVPSGYAEAIIPFNKSTGLPSALYGGNKSGLTLQISGPISVNGEVTKSDLMTGLEKLGQSILIGINKSGSGG